MTIAKRMMAAALFLAMTTAADCTPEPPTPNPESELIYRLWSFYELDDTSERRIGDTRTQIDGVVTETHDFGPLLLYPPGEGPSSQAEVFANETGQTYWVSAEAPRGALSLGEPIGNGVELTQFQEFRKTRADASLQIVVTQAQLWGIDSNGEVSALECPWAVRNRAFECNSVMSAWVTFRATAFDHSTGAELFRTGGMAELSGFRGAWNLFAASYNDAWVTLWDAASFDRSYYSEGDVLIRLAAPIRITVPLSTVSVGNHFRLSIHASAFTYNRRQRESYLSAKFRDPAELDGVAYVYSGLERIATPAESPPEPAPVPAPPCAGAPDPAAGTIELDAAAFDHPELPGAGALVVVTRSGGSRGAVSATLATSDGTALAGADYAPVTTPVLFANGEMGSRVVRIPIVTDRIAEPDETVNLTLSEPGGCAALGARTTAVLTIRDDDRGATTYTVGGTVTGLTGSGLALEEVRTGSAVTPQSGPFTFDHAFTDDSTYQVRVVTQPSNPTQVCSVSRGAGTIAGASVTDVAVDCIASVPSGLDATFGAAGLVTSGVPGGGKALALQPDGKIVVLGGLVLARFNADGSPDASFGGTGSVPIVWNGGPSDEALGLAVQPDGRIVVVGMTNVGNKYHMAVGRFESDGSPDAGFGTGGKTTIDPYAGVPGSHNHRAQKVLVQPDGKLVVAGSASLNGPGSVDNDFAAARLNADGTPDTGFGGDGATTIDVGGPVDLAYAVALQSDGKLVLAGRAGDNSTIDVGLVRLHADGQIDNDYGDDGNGRVLSDVTAGNWDEAADMVILPDDSIVVAVQAAFGSAFSYTVVHYSAGGGPADIVHTPIGPLSDYSLALARATDGKLIVAGQVSSGTVDDFGIVRYNADLTLDASFASGGVLLVDFFGASDGATDIALQPDGKIVVVGVARNGTGTGLGLLRANP